MKGIMFTSKGVTEIINEPEPECGDDEMLLKTIYSGISNGTERSFLTGGAYGGQKWPNRIGYLLISEVVKIGKDISRFSVGDVVYTGTFSGHVEYHTAKESDLVIQLPANVNPQAATMLGIAGVSYFNAMQAGVNEADNVLVTGSGGIGLMALQSAKSMGARVTLSSRTEHRRELGVQMGADEAFHPEDEGIRESGPYSVLLECAGCDIDPLIEPRKNLLDRFCRAALIAGRFRVEYNFLWASMLRVKFSQSTHFDFPTLEKVTSLASGGVLDLEAFVKDIVPIDRAVATYNMLRDHPMSLGGTVFDWTEPHDGA